MFKENTAYVILALVAIVLIGVTIGLQIVILSDQPGSPTDANDLPSLQSESLSGQIQSGQSQGSVDQVSSTQGSTVEGSTALNAETQSINSESAAASVGDSETSTEQVALALSPPTDTPAVIVLEPTAVQPTATPLPTSTPLPTATPEPLEPTSTALAIETQPEDQASDPAEPDDTADGAADGAADAAANDGSNTETSAAADDTAGGEPDDTATNETGDAQTGETGVAAAVEPTPVATNTIVAPLPTPTAEADVLFGVLDRGRDCTTMTQIAAQIMQDRLDVSVDFVAYASATEMIEALAQHSIDVTLCYMDPDDRSLMREFLGDIRQVGAQHMVGDGYKLQLWANDFAKADIREQAPCVLDLLEKIDFSELSVNSGNADTFIQTNGVAIAQWLDCPYQAPGS